jgi:hypothetical protein
MYKFYSKRNMAETWRDSDDIRIDDEHYFETFEGARKFILKFLEDKWNFIVSEKFNFRDDFRKKHRLETAERLKEVEFSLRVEQDKWHLQEMGSWAPCYYLKKVEVED